MLWNDAKLADDARQIWCYAAAMLTVNLGYLSRYKHCTNFPRFGNLTQVNVYLGKCSSVNTAIGYCRHLINNVRGNLTSVHPGEDYSYSYDLKLLNHDVIFAAFGNQRRQLLFFNIREAFFSVL